MQTQKRSAQRMKPGRKVYKVMMWLGVLLVFALADVGAASACSVGDSFVPPTNFELVQQAPLIVVVQAVSAKKGGRRGMNRIEMKILRVLKGHYKGKRLLVPGFTSRYFGRSEQHRFVKARRGAYVGSCVAYDYKIGRVYLLLMRSFATRWVVAGTPFARVNEEIDAKDSPWEEAVRHYVEIGKQANTELREAALRKLSTSLQKNATRYRGLIEDISRHLSAITPGKTTQKLIKAYQSAKNPYKKHRALMSIALRGDPKALAFWMSLFGKKASRSAIRAFGKYLSRGKPSAGTVSKAIELYIKTGPKRKQDRWSLMWALITKAGAGHQALMLKAFRGADHEEQSRLAQWFVRFPSKAAKDAISKALQRHPKNYNLRFALAGMGSKEIVAWISSQLSRRKTAPVSWKSNGWIVAYTIARCASDQGDKFAQQLISEGGEPLMWLIQGYQNARHPFAQRRLQQLRKMKHLTKKITIWLERTIKARTSCDSKPMSCVD